MTTRAGVLMKVRPTGDLQDYICSKCGKSNPISYPSLVVSECCGADLILFDPQLMDSVLSDDLNEVFDDMVDAPDDKSRRKNLFFMGAVAFSIPCLVVLATGWWLLENLHK